MVLFYLEKLGYLVIMCSSEEENQSYLASTLDSYQIQFLHRNRPINGIFNKAFCQNDEIQQQNKIIFGAVIDEERSVYFLLSRFIILFTKLPNFKAHGLFS